MSQQPNIRDQIVEKYMAALGEPEESKVTSGSTYRWTLERGRYDVAMYVTIDSPEHTDLAHVMISDSQTYQADPVISVVVYTMEEAEELLQRIIKQWKSKVTSP